MKSSYSGPATIYRHEHNGRVNYTLPIILNNIDGEKEVAYKQVQFRRGVEVADRTKINILSAWEKFYKTKDDVVVFYIFVNEFTDQEGKPVEPKPERPKQEEFEEIDEDVPF